MQLGIKCTFYGNVSHDYCRKCSLTDHPCEYPVDALEMMREENDEQSDRTEFTPSTLLECKRRVVLRTSNDYYLDPLQRWKMMRGEGLHLLFEKKGRFPKDSVVGTMREVRIKTDIGTQYGPQVFSGKADLIVVKYITEDGIAHVSITDYKTTEITHEKDGFSEEHEWTFREHQMQLNMYAYLVQLENAVVIVRVQGKNVEIPIRQFGYFDGVTGVVVDELELAYLDFKRIRRFTSKGTLVTRGKLKSRATWEYHDLPLAQMFLLPASVVEEYISRTIEEMIEAKSELPPRLEGKKASVVCPLCPLKETCFSLP